MAVKLYKPTTPARRGMTTKDTSAVTKQKPHKNLLAHKKSGSGRNNQGRITIRHRGGGVKKHYRIVTYRPTPGINATIEAIEYDPNRSANIALLKDDNGKYLYVLAATDMTVGQVIEVGEDAAVTNGNRLPLSAIPLGSFIYAIEMTIGKGAQMVRSAGTKAQLVAKDGSYAQVKLPSGEVRMIHLRCYATLGTVGNEQHQNVKWGSAGRRRRMGWRPSVRGKAMNPADHGMGGGEGQSSPGRHPVTPWGKKAIGLKTRRSKKSSKFIVRRRHESKR